MLNSIKDLNIKISLAKKEISKLQSLIDKYEGEKEKYKLHTNKDIKMKAFGYVYTIKNKKNGKVYVGASVNPYGRMQWHRYIATSELECTKKYKKELHIDISKYGIVNFEFKVIGKSYSVEAFKQAEIDWINKLDATNHLKGYNKVIASWNSTDKQRKNASNVRRLHNIGKTRSAETRKLIGKAQIGRSKSAAHRKAISKGIKLAYKRKQALARRTGRNLSRVKV
jgi:group I intron endonuclease